MAQKEKDICETLFMAIFIHQILEHTDVSSRIPGPTVGIVGGGQLGRMLAEAAAPLGVDVIVLDPTPDCPAAPVSRKQIVGEFDEKRAFDQLSSLADIVTFEIELADTALLTHVEQTHDVTVHPAPATLALIEDKLEQKRSLEAAGIAVPSFREVDTVAELQQALAEFGSVMLKARTGGYDGRGNVPVTDPDDASTALESIAGPAMAEEFIEFERELSVIAIQGADSVRTLPVGENIHQAEILRETVVPARTDETIQERAKEIAREVLAELDGRGVFGIELFETTSGEILVNEIAPRPHNSGHWSIEGAVTSQFEQHIRAIVGWPLGETSLLCPTVMCNLLATVEETCSARLQDVETLLEQPYCAPHWYGKDEARPLRKMGHVTLTASGRDISRNELLAQARDVREAVSFEDPTSA
jgi:5-(carboxyamino)imidazole ribonucleotide synthase